MVAWTRVSKPGVNVAWLESRSCDSGLHLWFKHPCFFFSPSIFWKVYSKRHQCVRKGATYRTGHLWPERRGCVKLRWGCSLQQTAWRNRPPQSQRDTRRWCPSGSCNRFEGGHWKGKGCRLTWVKMFLAGFQIPSVKNHDCRVLLWGQTEGNKGKSITPPIRSTLG